MPVLANTHRVPAIILTLLFTHTKFENTHMLPVNTYPQSHVHADSLKTHMLAISGSDTNLIITDQYRDS